jgi:PRTRC genetic system ThiF family protein
MSKLIQRTKVHFIQQSLLNPTNPISMIVVGCGGTGSHFLHAIARADLALTAMDHPGFSVTVFDPDKVELPNMGRSEFNRNYVEVNKAVALVSHINRSYGTNWKAVPHAYEPIKGSRLSEDRLANLIVSCVDTVSTRFSIAKMLSNIKGSYKFHRDRPAYWLDFGNSKYTGQAILSTTGTVAQPKSKKFIPIGNLPSVTEEFGELLKSSEKADPSPSCSMLQSLNEQSLYINSALANYGASLLQQLLEKGYTPYRGFFMNLENFRTEPIPV